MIPALSLLLPKYMRKEILIATIAGVIFGLIIAFGIWRTNSALKTNSSGAETSNSSTQNGEKTEAQELKISIASPQENDVVWENPVKISGITKPQSLVVVSTESEDYVLTSSDSGEFEQEVELQAGVNQILISAQGKDSATCKKDLTLVYSTEFAEQLGLD